ncbi:ras-related protein Rab-28-like isoform X2 [Oratosquilla oratoria]
MSDSEDEGLERQVKVVLAGAPQVGKTSLAHRYAHDSFVKNYQASVGVDFFLKRLTLSGGKNVNLQIWDIAGSSLTGRMTDKYLYGADAVLLVYDVTSPTSLDALDDWVSAARRATRVQEKPPVMALLANKADLEHERQVKSERHHRFATDHGLASHVVSARTGEGVALTFQKIAAELLGIRLTKAEQEQQQPVVKAEIVTYPETQMPRASTAASTSTSSVCRVM